MIAISVCATKSYLYAFKSCIRRIIAASYQIKEDIALILVTDTTPECKKASEFVKSEIPSSWILKHVAIDVSEEGEKYKKDRQILIASIQGESFAQARLLNADYLWSVEPDILVSPDSLKVLLWALKMPTEGDSFYYDVAFGTYPNGQFLGGHGDPQHAICEDFLPKERKIPKELKKAIALKLKEEKAFLKNKKTPPKEWIEESQKLQEKIKQCPPKSNVWGLNFKFGWRRRGWLDHAYPGIGKGSLLKTDWVGLGNTLFSKKALALANFDGYTGAGTQDLYLCWHKWYPSDIKLCVSPHTLSDHIKPEIIDGKETGKYINYNAYHEQLGESKGHLRVRNIPWIEI